MLAALLLAATLTALPHARLANLHPFAPHGWLAIAPAAAVLVWGFAGWEAVTSLAGDFRNPRRDVPRATAVALVVVALLYLGVAGASALVLGSAAGDSGAPLADLLAVGAGGPARALTSLVAVLLTFGAMNAYFAGGARLGAALGRDAALPAWFAQGATTGAVPRRSLGVVCGLSFVALAAVAATGGPHASVLLTTGSFVLVYLVGTAAAVRLLPRASWPRRAAVVALVAVELLVGVTGLYLAAALLVALAAVGYDRYRHGRRGGTGPLGGLLPGDPGRPVGGARESGAEFGEELQGVAPGGGALGR